MPNTENINKLIEWIKKDQAAHFTMSAYVGHLDENGKVDDNPPPEKYLDCKTAFCLAGYANLLRLEEEEAMPKETTGADFVFQFSSHNKAAEWLGIEDLDYLRLFLMAGSRQRAKFDDLPPSLRATIAIDVLEHLRDTGEIDWNRSLAKHAPNFFNY